MLSCVCQNCVIDIVSLSSLSVFESDPDSAASLLTASTCPKLFSLVLPLALLNHLFLWLKFVFLISLIIERNNLFSVKQKNDKGQLT